MFWRAVILLAVALLLSGCATPQTRTVVQVQKVEVPVPVKCRPAIDAAPTDIATPDALVRSPNIQGRIDLLLAQRIQDEKRLAELSAALMGCEGS